MGTIQDLYEAVGQIRLREKLPEMIIDTKTQIQIKVTDQLDDGTLSTGDKISPLYALEDYAKKKNLLNSTPGFGVPDARLTGDLYNEIEVTANQEEYDIHSNVPYATDKNILQYGPHLLEMSEESKEEYCEESLLPAIQNYITEKTGLLFS